MTTLVRSVGVAFAVADYLLLNGGAATAILAPSWALKAIGVVVSGVATAMLFALAHDAAHGSLAAQRLMNRVSRPSASCRRGIPSRPGYAATTTLACTGCGHIWSRAGRGR
jgi:hypothetical protein